MKTKIILSALLIFCATNHLIANDIDTSGQFYINKRGVYQPVERANIFTHRHVLKFGVGYSREQQYVNGLFKKFDTEQIFEYQAFSPVYSLTHEIYMDEIFSMSYSLGFMNSEIKMADRPIQTYQANLFVHPKLNYFRSKRFEAYFQLNIGVVYNDLNKENIEHEALRKNLTPTFKLFTGFSPLGVNIRLTDRLWFNVEGSLWSYEAVSCGLKLKLGENQDHPRLWVGI